MWKSSILVYCFRVSFDQIGIYVDVLGFEREKKKRVQRKSAEDGNVDNIGSDENRVLLLHLLPMLRYWFVTFYVRFVYNFLCATVDDGKSFKAMTKKKHSESTLFSVVNCH